jgi:phosphoribosylformylglycinamidine synthase
MKAIVIVTLKPGVLDPQGKAIHHSAESLGFERLIDIRQGKYFEIELDPAIDDADAEAAVTRLAADILSNPVIEDYKVEIVG